MQDLVEKVIRNFKEFFVSLDFSKKVGLVGTSALIVAAMVTMILWVTKTRYEVLYTDLNREDSKKIEVLLTENKIPYEKESDGKVIKIPKDMVKKWRLQIATLGVNFSGSVGYEVFDKQSFGTTSFVQKVNKQRALEGELIKTIKYIRGVKRARVHLSIPESSPFVSEKKPPTASVVLELKRGSSLTQGEIKGISHL